MPTIHGSISIRFADQELILLPDRAAWWPSRRALIIADAHLGKAASFRMAGIPVPAGATAKDLARLTSLLEQTAAQRLIVLGDFLHSRSGRQKEVLDAIAAWRKAHDSIPILLIRGNHDRSAGRVPAEWQIQEMEEPLIEDDICLAHRPNCDHSCPMLAGHVHPVISLRDYDGSSITLPAFIADPDCLILPSFGTFTGGFRMDRLPDRRIFAVAGGRIVAVKDEGR